MAGPNPKPVPVVEGLEEHPATQAWLRLNPGSDIPSHIDKFNRPGRANKMGKSSVFRMHGVGSGAGAVIAKRGLRDTVALELLIYEHFLSRLPISSIRVLGSLTQADSDMPWLFLEDGGEEPFSRDLREHRHSAARWLAGLHAGAATLLANTQLPPRGSAFYRGSLSESRVLARQCRLNPALTEAHHATLDQMEHITEELERRWTDLDVFCDRMPMTLVHGDFAPKNIRVGRGDRGALSMFVFDWEMAGLGCPAADLWWSQTVAEDDTIGQYSGIAREHWQDLTDEDVTRMAQVGQIFRTVAAIGWACESLQFDDVKLPLENLSRYVVRLRNFASQLS